MGHMVSVVYRWINSNSTHTSTAKVMLYCDSGIVTTVVPFVPFHTTDTSVAVNHSGNPGVRESGSPGVRDLCETANLRRRSESQTRPRPEVENF